MSQTFLMELRAWHLHGSKFSRPSFSYPFFGHQWSMSPFQFLFVEGSRTPCNGLVPGDMFLVCPTFLMVLSHFSPPLTRLLTDVIAPGRMAISFAPPPRHLLAHVSCFCSLQRFSATQPFHCPPPVSKEVDASPCPYPFLPVLPPARVPTVLLALKIHMTSTFSCFSSLLVRPLFPRFA